MISIPRMIKTTRLAGVRLLHASLYIYLFVSAFVCVFPCVEGNVEFRSNIFRSHAWIPMQIARQIFFP